MTTAIPNVTEAGYYAWGVYVGSNTHPTASFLTAYDADQIAERFDEMYPGLKHKARRLPERKVN